MNLHKLKAVPNARNHRTKRVGRGFGSGIGGRSTRGTKGQKQRKSGNVRLGFEGGQTPLYRLVGKIGFNNKPFKKDVTAVQIKHLLLHKDVNVFDRAKLVELKLIHRKAKYIKVIGNDNVTRPLEITASAFSKQAINAIIAAGGKVNIQQKD